MGAGSFWLLGAICVGWFSLAGRRAFEAWKDLDYRGSWAWVFCSIGPVSGLAVMVFQRGEVDVVARNFTLGLLGAILGMSGLIYVGYWFDGHASTKTSPASQGPIVGSSPTVNAPNNHGIITFGQKGDNLSK
jgi:hypothetical protein